MALICSKIFIVLLSVLEFLCGLSVAGLGSTIRALVLKIPVAIVKITAGQAATSYKKDFSMLQAGIEYVSSAATGLIAFGLMMVVASMLGVYGACCDSPCLLYLFLPIMAILAATDVIVGVLILVGRMKIVTWFGDVTDCDACESLVKYLTSFAVPAAGLTLFSALPKIFAIYCAWRIIQYMKECQQDKKLMRNFLRGRPQAPPQQNSQQPIFILAGGAQQPIQNNINNIIQPGYMPMQPMQQQQNAMGMHQQQQMGMQPMGSQHNMMNQPMGQQPNHMMHGGPQQMQQQPMMQQQHNMMNPQHLQPQQQPRMQQQSTFTPELLPKNQPSSKLGAKKDSKRKVSNIPASEIPPPPPPPPVGFTPKRKQFNTDNEIESEEERPRNPTPNVARKYNNNDNNKNVNLSSESMKRSKAVSNVLIDQSKNNNNANKFEPKERKISEKTRGVKVLPNNVINDSRASQESGADNVFIDEGDSSQIIVNRTRLSSLPSEYRRTFGSGTSGMVSVVEEDMK